MVTVAQLQRIFPKAKAANLAAFCDEINEAAVEFEIDSPRRLAAFLAQCAHESGLFAHVRENLNYSAKGLMGIFKKYFPTLALAEQYARKPEMIASKELASSVSLVNSATSLSSRSAAAINGASAVN